MKYLVTNYRKKSSTMLLSEEVKHLVTIRGGQAPFYYQRRPITIREGQVPCYYQRMSSTFVTIRGGQVPLLLLEEVKYLCYYQRSSPLLLSVEVRLIDYTFILFFPIHL